MLRETAINKEMYKMQEYQQRVIDEKTELEAKVNKLNDFIGHNPAFDKIDPAEQERIKEQNDIMWQYVEVLERRIAAFPSVNTEA